MARDKVDGLVAHLPINQYYLSNYWGVFNSPGGYDGAYFIDLNGANLGTISSEITNLAVGQQYQLSFAMSGNPRGPGLKTLDLTVGAVTQGYSFDYVLEGVSSTDLKWQVMTFDFTASSSVEALTFTSTTASSSFYGPMIDGVTITAVPLPAAIWLFAGGLLGLAGFARK